MNNPSKNVKKGVYGGFYVIVATAVRFLCTEYLNIGELEADSVAAGTVALIAGLINYWKHRRG